MDTFHTVLPVKIDFYLRPPAIYLRGPILDIDGMSAFF